jgi:hypothetical protein
MDFDYGWMRTEHASGTVGTESLNNTHVEPTSLACYGATPACSGSTNTGLYYYYAFDQSWRLWTSNVFRWTVEDPCYDFYDLLPNYSFLTIDRAC